MTDIQHTPLIPIGFNVRLFPNLWRPAREDIAFAGAHGFGSMQFPTLNRGLDADMLGDSIDVVAKALHQANIVAVMEIVVRVDETGLTTSGLTPLDVLEANLPAITTFPCACVHWHLVSAKTDAAIVHALETQLIPQFAAAVELAQKHNVRFGFEHNALAPGFFADPEQCVMLLEAVPGLGFVWDLNHTPPDRLSDHLALVPYLTMLHVSDTPLPTVNHHLPLGLGTINFVDYFHELLRRGFRGPAILEIGGHPDSGGFGRDTDETLIDSRMRLAKAIAAASRRQTDGDTAVE
ncbi:MAG: sugar phosphate isomerase/epimerase [Chloroflexi bacterium AL-N10]|nr:sugar phosphate isomerase/epimerase [Chloroflexi bacterium AL-N1]NOK69587.1 sugar phosphate isomerase/epimerase [Chloroflexi bacterium AL-N10]NOK72134.1 sugar phosphate isomerase/epimerase [Chloroflexi bacterium AL-N5]